MRGVRVVSLAGVLTLGLFMSCTEGDSPFDVTDSGRIVALAVVPFFPEGLAAANADPIVQIRATVSEIPGGRVVSTQTFAVNPNDEEWQLDIEIPLADDPTIRYLVDLELLNASGVVEFSARLGPFTVVPGGAPSVRQAELVRGPLENLGVTGLDVSGPTSILEGEPFSLTAEVQTANGAQPTVFWTPLDPQVASVDEDGNGMGLSPGTARFEAAAGAFTDMHTLVVIGVPADVVIMPPTVLLTELGETVRFEAEVVDSQGGATGDAVRFSVADGRVLRDLGGGLFEAVGGGTTAVRAEMVGNPDLFAEATVEVELVPLELRIEPPELHLTALGETFQLEVIGIDALGGEIFGLQGVWSSPGQFVDVDQDGVVTALANGDETVMVELVELSLTAVAPITVRQVVQTVTLDPPDAVLTSIGETQQYTAVAFDALGSPVPDAQFDFGTGDDGVATIDGNGLLTAEGGGRTTVRVQSGEAFAETTVEVVPPLESVRISPTSATIKAGEEIRFSAVGIDFGGNEVPLADVEFESSNPQVFVMFNNGLGIGARAGDAMVTATEPGGLFATADVTVEPATTPVLPGSYQTAGNTQLVGGSFSVPSTPHVFDPDGLLPSGSTLTVETQGFFQTSNGAGVEINPDGSFSYWPAPSFIGQDDFTFDLSNGEQGTATVDVSQPIWYVNNLSGAGQGTGESSFPFGDLFMAASASGPGDIIFVHEGDGTTNGYDAGFTMKDGQQLIGELADLTVSPFGQIAPPGPAAPIITNSGLPGNGITAANDTKIEGVNVEGTTGHGIRAADVGDVTIEHVTIRNTSLNGVSAGGFLTPVDLVMLADVTIENAGANALGFSFVSDLTAQDITILGGVRPIFMNDLTGTSVFDNVFVDNPAGANAIDQSAGGTGTISILNSTFNGRGFELEAHGTTQTNLNIQNSTFSNAVTGTFGPGNGLSIMAFESGQASVSITGGSVTGNDTHGVVVEAIDQSSIDLLVGGLPVISGNTSDGMQLRAFGDGQLAAEVRGGFQINNSGDDGIDLQFDGSASSTFDVRILESNIGSSGSNGIVGDFDGSGTARVVLNGLDISGSSLSGIALNSGLGSPNWNLHVTNNDVFGGSSGPSILIDNDAQGPLCVNIANNTGVDIQLREGPNTTPRTQVQRFNGGSGTVLLPVPVEQHLILENPGISTAAVVVNNGYDGVPNSACPIASVPGSSSTKPSANPQATTTNANAPVVVTLTATDADSDALTFSVATQPSDGTLGAITPLSSNTAQVTYTPNPAFIGADFFEFRVTDPGGDQSVARVDVDVQPLGPQNASYTSAGNTELIAGGFPAPLTPHASDAFNILDPSPGLTVTSTGIQATTQGGQVNMQADGSFSYTPPVGFTGADDTFQYTVVGPQTATVTITVTDMVWFVDNTASPGGTGLSNDPFDQLSSALDTNPSSGSPAAAPGDAVFLDRGNGSSNNQFQGVTFQAGQRLIGEGVALDIPGVGQLHPAGQRPLLGHPTDAAIVLAQGNTIRGLNIANTAGSGMRGAGGLDGVLVEDMIIQNSNGDGIQLTNPTGTLTFNNVDLTQGAGGLSVTGGSANVSFNGTITSSQGMAVLIQLATGGQIDVLGGPHVVTGGSGVVLGNTNGNVTVDGLDVQSGFEGILIQGSTAQFDFPNTRIAGTVGDAFSLIGGAPVVSVTVNQITNNSEWPARIESTTGGSVTFDPVGAGATITDAGGRGIRIQNNVGDAFFNLPVSVSTPNEPTAVNIAGSSGTISFDDLTINSGTSAGIDLQSNTGTVTVTNGSVTTQDNFGINIDGSTANLTFASVDINVGPGQFGGLSISNSPSSAMSIGTLTLVGTDSKPLVINNGGSFTVTGGTIDGPNDGAVNISGTALNVDLSDVGGSSSDTPVISISQSTGTFIASDGAITGDPTEGVFLSGNNMSSFLYGGTINTTSGNSVSITGSTGGFYEFDGPISDAANGIIIQNNTGGTFSFVGDLTLAPTSGQSALVATAPSTPGGNLQIWGGTHAVNVTNAVGIDITNVSIVGPGVTFESINVSGSPDDGIVLFDAGSGGFNITGSVGPGSGGTIDNSGARGIDIAATDNISLNNVNVTNSVLQGIRLNGIPNGIDNVTLDGLLLDNNGSALGSWPGLESDQVTGNFNILNTTIQGSDGVNLNIFQSILTSTILVDNSAFDLSDTGSGALVSFTGLTTVSNMTFTGNSFDQNPNLGMQIVVGGTSTVSVQIDGSTTANTFTDNNAGALNLVANENGDLDFDVVDNLFSGAGHGLQINGGTTTTAGGRINGTVDGNTFIGSAIQHGIDMNVDGAAPTNLLIQNNSITGFRNHGIKGFFSFLGGSTNNSHLIVTNNTIDVPLSALANAIHVGVDNGGSLCLSVNGTGNTITNNGNLESIFGGQFGSSTFFAQGLGAPTTNAPDIETLFAGQNGLLVTDVTWSLSGTANGATCTPPN